MSDELPVSNVIPVASPQIVNDPLGFASRCWPLVSFYKEQRETIYSVRDNDETIVPAANQLGKDFVAAFIAIWWMMRTRPARVLATSPQFSQLDDVLWGEIRKMLRASRVPLPLKSTHMLVRQTRNDGSVIEAGECRGQAVSKGEALLGRHVPRITDDKPWTTHYKRMGEIGIPCNLLIVDEGSGMEDEPYLKSDTWAQRRLVIGNCYPTTNFFYKGVQAGDRERPGGKGYTRKVIKIRADQSPNVKLALKEIAEGKPVSNTTIIPGVKDYPTYIKHREEWDEVQQSIQLDAEFWEGEEFFLFPREVLEAVSHFAAGLNLQGHLTTMGVDTAEGGDNTSWAVTGTDGLVDLVSIRTPDTSTIPKTTIELIHDYKINPKNVAFDRGGGGKQHADNLRNAKSLGFAKQDYPVRTVGFGESAKAEKKRGVKSVKKLVLEDEEKYVYKNRRVQMYGILSIMLQEGYKIPHSILHKKFRSDRKSLYDQLRPIPKLLDKEGQLYLPPKNKKNPDSKETTLVELIGHSPDESDAVVLGTYCQKFPARMGARAIT